MTGTDEPATPATVRWAAEQAVRMHQRGGVCQMVPAGRWLRAPGLGVAGAGAAAGVIGPGEVVNLTDWHTRRPVTIRVDRAVPVAGEQSWFEVDGVELRDGRPVPAVRGRVQLIDEDDEEQL